MMLTIYSARRAQPADFVTFWARQYDNSLEELYADNIAHPLTPERIRQLFKWKNGSRLSALKQQSVEKNYVAQLPKLRSLRAGTSAGGFLKKFPSGGAIWRIFWMHCWQPNRFPIYDQHVHRAMVFVQRQQLEEIPNDDSQKVRQYITQYLPFHERFRGADRRAVDKALWSYGKFLKTNRFPIP